MRTLILLVAAAAATGAHAQALPEPAAAPGKGFLERNDRNGDGALDAEEYRNFCARLFARRDRNADGVLTPDEYPATSDALQRVDFMAQSDASFENHDRNGDERLDLGEIAALRAASDMEEP